MTQARTSCWQAGDPAMQAYHDSIWGRPVLDDRVAFELLTLSVFQAGLSWQVVFNKRAAFAAFFLNYDLRRLATELDLASDRAIAAAPIKNAAKLRATVANANAALRCAALHGGSFCKYLWSLVNGEITHAVFDHCVTQDDLSRRVAATLKRDGFAFLGPVSAYSYFQSIGVIQAHKPNCHAFVPHRTIKQFEESLTPTNSATTATNNKTKGKRKQQTNDANDTAAAEQTTTTPLTRRVRARKAEKKGITTISVQR
jgi:DNA-3-methyladenine glycosylase I